MKNLMKLFSLFALVVTNANPVVETMAAKFVKVGLPIEQTAERLYQRAQKGLEVGKGRMLEVGREMAQQAANTAVKAQGLLNVAGQVAARDPRLTLKALELVLYAYQTGLLGEIARTAKQIALMPVKTAKLAKEKLELAVAKILRSSSKTFIASMFASALVTYVLAIVELTKWNPSLAKVYSFVVVTLMTYSLGFKGLINRNNARSFSHYQYTPVYTY